MSQEKNTSKSKLHPRNKHRERYNFKELIKSSPDLADYVFVNQYQNETIDFFDAEAVKTLNTALLKYYYGIEFWDIFPNYLCPPIPGRADYIHHIADLLASQNEGKVPKGKRVKVLDIGVGANCIYPMIGNKEYGWTFIGTDVDFTAIKSAKNIIQANPSLHGKIDCRWQPNPRNIFYEVLDKEERIDLVICNPPFHSSLEEAQAGTLRKLRNLSKFETSEPVSNFGGQKRELWTEGGEKKFVQDMIFQSKHFSNTCFWFSTLVSKESHLKRFYSALEKARAVEVKTIEMGQGNKKSRILAWTFFSKTEQDKWVAKKWNRK
ncbi:MAG: 23S rRNA (adenine(1618)-N(6))-methyltransferase RlmF [Chitinophagales bacterium]